MVVWVKAQLKTRVVVVEARYVFAFLTHKHACLTLVYLSTERVISILYN